METKSINHLPRVICLTLPKEHERQQQASKEFQKVGIKNFEFFNGVTPSSQLVKQAYAEGRVKQYPNCFRCGKKDCGNSDCNNILLPVQVAVTLSFQTIMKSIVEGQDAIVAVCEDDIIFARYAPKILSSLGAWENIYQETGLEGTTPVLIRLGNSSLPSDFGNNEPPYPIKLSQEAVMSNYFFIVNKAFAKIAAEKLLNITHTADVIIHKDMMDSAQCYTLTPQLVADRSWSLGSTESLIHPKPHHINYLTKQYGASSPQALNAKKRLIQHRKKAISLRYGFIGQPQCGGVYVSNFLKKNGVDVNLKGIGSDGICAWQYVIDSENYPLLIDEKASSKYFVHIENYYLYVQNPINAIPALMIENQSNSASYEFRRENILKQFDVDLNDFSSPIEQATRAYIHWYQLALMQKPKAILRIENLLEDWEKHSQAHDLKDLKPTTKTLKLENKVLLSHLCNSTKSLLHDMNYYFGYNKFI